MGKKGLKRKTRWRPLSISECTGDDTSTVASITNSTTETNIEEDDTTYKYSVKNSSYLRRKLLPFTASSTNRTDYRNNNNNNSNNLNSNSNYYRSSKHNANNNTTSSSSVPLYTSSARYSYRRRLFSASNHYQNDSSNFSNNNSKYYSNRSIGGGRFINRIHHYRTVSEPSDKENTYNSSSLKPQLNEDEYTRITTPRQDVIFKKSYLNQPKRYLSSTDTNTTSSAAASVVSTEESISATSVPSLSPEQCSSMTDSIDPEHQAFMYSYFDQNGVFYVNPFLPNGFDQYGQMFMLPYGYSPYIFQQNINNPLINGDVEESQTSNEMNEDKNDLKNSKDVVVNKNNENENKNKENLNENINNLNKNDYNNEKMLLNNKNLSESCDSIEKTLNNNNNDNNDNNNKIINNHINNENNNNNNTNTNNNNANKDDEENDNNQMENNGNNNTGTNDDNGKISIATDKNEDNLNVNEKENLKENVEKLKENIENNGANYNKMNANNCNKIFKYNSNEKLEKFYKNTKRTDIPSCDPNDYYNYGYQQYYPPIFYPYVYSQPFIPTFEEYNNSSELYDDDDRNNGAKRRKRIRIDENSTDATTTDYSEDEYSEDDDDDDDITEIPEINDTNENSVVCEACDNFKENQLTNNQETESKATRFNMNVDEFIPKKNKPHLNVHVKEFHPRNYTSAQQVEQNSELKVKKIEEIKESESMSTKEVVEDTTTEKTEKSCEVLITTTKMPKNIIKSADTKASVGDVTIAQEVNENEIKRITGTKSQDILSPSTLLLESVVNQPKEQEVNVSLKSLSPVKKSTEIVQTKEQSVKQSTMTLAEKIKKSLSEELKTKQKTPTAIPNLVSTSESKLMASKSSKTERKSVPPKKSGSILSERSQTQKKKSSQRKNELQNSSAAITATTTATTTAAPSTTTVAAITTEATTIIVTKSVPTYAQMLNNESSTSIKKSENNNTTISNNPAIEKSTKGLLIESKLQEQEREKQQQPNSVQSNSKTAESSNTQIWLRVKSRGKRNKHIQEVTAFKNEESISKNEENETVIKSEQCQIEEIPELILTEKLENLTINQKTENDEISKTMDTIPIAKSSLDEITKDNTINTSSSTTNKKGAKSKNKKSRKISAGTNKKLKGFELKEPRIEIGRKNQNEKPSRSLSSSLFESQDKLTSLNVDTLFQLTPKLSEEDLTLNHLYDHEKTNPFTRSFAASSLEILNGFDYKFYKGSSILKEEEEMVLNVIKSLSLNQKKNSSTIKTEGAILDKAPENKIEKSEELKTEIEKDRNDTAINSKNVVQSSVENNEENKINEEIEQEENNVAEIPAENLKSIAENSCDNNSKNEVNKDVIPKPLNEIDDSVSTNLKPDELNHVNEITEPDERSEETVVNEVTLSPKQCKHTENEIHHFPLETQFLCNGNSESETSVHNSSPGIVTNGDLLNGHADSISLDSADSNETSEVKNSSMVEIPDVIYNNEHKVENKMQNGEVISAKCTISKEESHQDMNSNGINCNGFKKIKEKPSDIDTKTENLSIKKTKCNKSIFRNSDGAEDFYKLIKIDDSMSTNIADQLKTIEDQLKNLERIASVSSLNGSRSDVNNSETEAMTLTTETKDLKTAEKFHNNEITEPSNSIPSTIDNVDEISLQCNSTDIYSIKKHKSNSNSTDVNLVPNNNDHVLNGYENTQLLLTLNNEFDVPNCCSSQNENPIPNTKITDKNERHENVTSSVIDRIRSNSVEYYCNEDKCQRQTVHENQSVCNNLKAISDNSINATNSCRYPLTNAVKQWLKDTNANEKLPEQPILRIPDDPTLSTRIKSTMIGNHLNHTLEKNVNLVTGHEQQENNDGEDDGDDDNSYSEDENEIDTNYHFNQSKNLLSNPSHVSSVKQYKKLNRKYKGSSLTNDHCNQLKSDEIDSDYNSDSQLQQQHQMQQQQQQQKSEKRLDFDDNTCERVASLLISGTTTAIVSTEDEDDEYRKNEKLRKENLKNTIVTIPPSLTGKQHNQQQQHLQQQQQQDQSEKEKSMSDLLDYWDDEFIQNPKKWLKNTTNDTDMNKSKIINENEKLNKENKILNKKKKKRKSMHRKTMKINDNSSLNHHLQLLSQSTKLKSSTTSTSTSTIQSQSTSSIQSIDEIELIPYESVYGKTIDYNRLLNENNYEFLSNTIINNFNHNHLNRNHNQNNNYQMMLNNNPNKKIQNNSSIQIDNNNGTLLNNHNHNCNNNKKNDINDINDKFNNNDTNNFDNNIKFINNNNNGKITNNCLKPPEVCCIVM